MRGKGSDQGGRWSVGLWLALVGVSAGTVASFSLIGWTFTQGLYDGGNGTEPLEFDSETVILEAEETPEGVAGGDELEGLVEPGTQPDGAASPAEPRAERLQEGAGDVPEAPADVPAEEQHEAEEATPPQLVPVDEDDGHCGRGESGLWPDDGHGEESARQEGPILRLLTETPEFDAAPDLDLDMEPFLEPEPAPFLEPGPQSGRELDSDLGLLD